jgi:hypothetical protein
VRSLRRYLLAFSLVAALGAMLSACGSGDGAHLLPGTTATEINSNLDQVQSLAAEGECVGASNAADEVAAEVAELGGVDAKLKTLLAEGAEKLQEVVVTCEESEEEPAETTEEEEPEPEEEEKAPKHEKPEKEKPPKEEGPPAEPPEPPGQEEEKGKGEGPPEEGGSSSGGLGPAQEVEGD